MSVKVKSKSDFYKRMLVLHKVLEVFVSLAVGGSLLICATGRGLGQFPDVDPGWLSLIRIAYPELLWKTQAANCLMVAMGALVVLILGAEFVMECSNQTESTDSRPTIISIQNIILLHTEVLGFSVAGIFALMTAQEWLEAARLFTHISQPLKCLGQHIIGAAVSLFVVSVSSGVLLVLEIILFLHKFKHPVHHDPD